MSAPFRLDRSVIRVSGPDLESFLQNLLTQDAVLAPGEGRYAALLTPQGKVVADMILYGAVFMGVNIEGSILSPFWSDSTFSRV